MQTARALSENVHGGGEMNAIRCDTMSDIRKAVQSLPNADHPATTINGVTVERTGESGWLVDNRWLCYSPIRATLRLVVTGQDEVELDMVTI